MPKYKYKVRAPQGGEMSGVMEAKIQKDVTDKLRGQKFIILSIEEEKKNIANSLIDAIPFMKKEKGKRVGAKNLVLFSRQLSTLVSAGVPIVQGLGILVEQIESKVFKQVISDVKTDIEGGLSIADSMAKYPTVFDELYVGMVRSGETGGVLDIILERLSAYLESTSRLVGKVKSAMVYPTLVTLVAIGITVFMLVAVIPTFKTVFTAFGGELPMPTQILIGISEFLRKFILVFIIGTVIALFALRQYIKTEKGSRIWDSFLLKLPVFGPLIRKVAIAKFSRTLGTLIKSGVPILDAISTTGKTAGNKIVEDAVMSARENIREGERIAAPLKESGVFPPMVTQMISVGEETGALDNMLHKVADFYDQEVEVAVAGLTSMIEPLIIVVMGVVIGAMVIAMFLPIFELGEVVSKATQ
ncbi:MAG: type II secretion system F family protein [bacterium]|nr:type II secretion system F family protein [bacterium]MDD5755985.1 type II secretion system F family protein [bacterium]